MNDVAGNVKSTSRSSHPDAPGGRKNVEAFFVPFSVQCNFTPSTFRTSAPGNIAGHVLFTQYLRFGPAHHPYLPVPPSSIPMR